MLSEIFSVDDPVPVGMRVDDLIVGMRIDGRDHSTGVLPTGAAGQLAQVHENLRRCVEMAGSDLDHVAQVSFFLQDFGDRTAINSPWVAMFPDKDDRPTYKFMPAVLPDGELVHVEFFATTEGERRTIHLPGVAHANPIPMAVRIGRYLFTSRLLAYDPATQQAAEGAAAQTKFLFQNAAEVLGQAGMSWADVMQGRAFAADDMGAALVARAWSERFPHSTRRPPLHPTRYGAGSLVVMLELIAREGGLV